VDADQATGEAAPASLTVDDAMALIRASGGRVTTARRLLIGVLFEQGPTAHLTAEELTERLQSQLSEVHASTVYRNLEDLEQLGVVSHTHLGHGPAVYHLASHEHGHLVCDTCGRTIEVSTSMFRPLIAQARERHGFVVDPGHSAVLGRCRECVRDATSPNAR
jgi:Fe2+ or Zn2+ uptake regulation protein